MTILPFQEFSLQIAGMQIMPISPSRPMREGDVICSYESTSTNPVTFSITTLQQIHATIALLGKNLQNMVHWEIVLRTLPGNWFEVAHASGSVLIQPI